jgi:multiple sugar transport system permease protein
LTIILLAIFIFPIIQIVRLSFTNTDLVGSGYEYTLNSYGSLFTAPYFFNMLTVTAIFVFTSVTFQMVFGFLIALAVDQGGKRGMRASVVTRTAVLSAWAIFNYILSLVGLGPIPFLSDPEFALASVTIANIWRGTAFSMILAYAGLQTVPGDVIEAAKIDGASAFQRMTRITLPLIAPILFINLVIVSIETFNTFDMVLALTGGGPGRSTEVLALSIYNQIFAQFDLGQGAATAVLLLVISVIMTIVYIKLLQRDEEAV